MKKLLVVVGLGLCCIILPIKETQAQIPIYDINPLAELISKRMLNSANRFVVNKFVQEL